MHVIFINCSNKDCESNPYPVAVGMEATLSKCPVCDPKAHSKATRVAAEANKIDNKPKVDPNRVISLEEGGFILDGGPSVEVPNTHEAYVAPDDGMKIPVIPEGKPLTPQQRGANTRRENAKKK